MTNYRFLTFDILERLIGLTLERHGGLSGVRDLGAIESALQAPQNDALYGDADIFAVGAAYLFHLSRAHGFADGNKRASMVALGAFLWANGVESRPSPDQLEALALDVAASRMDKAETVERVRQLFGE